MVFCRPQFQEEGSQVYWSPDIETRCMGSTSWIHLQQQQQYYPDIANGNTHTGNPDHEDVAN